MIKIALPTRDESVDNHFGHCEYYTVFTLDADKKITGKETLPSPQGCGCKSNIASVLHEMGVTLMLAGNMGEGAKNVLERNGISVIRGCSGAVNDVVATWIAGAISDSGEGCHHHEEGEHQCPGH